MKKALPWISILAIIISTISIFLSIRTEGNTSKIKEKMNIYIPDSLDVNEFERRLYLEEKKESYYIEQLGRETNYIIFYVSILFAILGIVGYGVFYKAIEIESLKQENKINEGLNEFNKALSEFSEEHRKSLKQIDNNQQRLDITIGNVFSIASEFIKNDDHQKFIFCLSAVKYFCNSISYEGVLGGHEIIDSVHVLLKDIIKLIDQKNIKLIDSEFENNRPLIIEMLNDISNSKIDETLDLISEIRYKINN